MNKRFPFTQSTGHRFVFAIVTEVADEQCPKDCRIIQLYIYVYKTGSGSGRPRTNQHTATRIRIHLGPKINNRDPNVRTFKKKLKPGSGPGKFL